jgi:hypothetical protein
MGLHKALLVSWRDRETEEWTPSHKKGEEEGKGGRRWKRRK